MRWMPVLFSVVFLVFGTLSLAPLSQARSKKEKAPPKPSDGRTIVYDPQHPANAPVVLVEPTLEAPMPDAPILLVKHSADPEQTKVTEKQVILDHAGKPKAP